MGQKPSSSLFIDKAVYAKLPDHVKKILNRAYLEDNPYNDIVLHLEQGMRRNGLGTPNEVTLVPLNKIEVAQPQTDTKPTENRLQNNKKGHSFYCNKFGHFKAECRKMERDKWQQNRKNSGYTSSRAGNYLKCGRLLEWSQYLRATTTKKDKRTSRLTHDNQKD